jgi:hypothetical protein
MLCGSIMIRSTSAMFPSAEVNGLVASPDGGVENVTSSGSSPGASPQGATPLGASPPCATPLGAITSPGAEDDDVDVVVVGPINSNESSSTSNTNLRSLFAQVGGEGWGKLGGGGGRLKRSWDGMDGVSRRGMGRRGMGWGGERRGGVQWGGVSRSKWQEQIGHQPLKWMMPSKVT